jgi:hypothetical protein
MKWCLTTGAGPSCCGLFALSSIQTDSALLFAPVLLLSLSSIFAETGSSQRGESNPCNHHSVLAGTLETNTERTAAYPADTAIISKLDTFGKSDTGKDKMMMHIETTTS